MKTYAHYDVDGSIRALVVTKLPKGMGMMLAPEPGLMVGEIEDVKLKVKTEHDVEVVRELADSHRIAAARCTLKKR